uniref:Uncharacterized LOC100186143 n=1 Tax=Ciona intestinalis TaxID=7719 RepID=F7BM78_CIOIN|nr:uncharacterized protein LOC100186143 [Ciona intestinalis]|eukprot:XP_002131997.1 uncharacterized protein LOC100186143 [Ciona intestinalis]
MAPDPIMSSTHHMRGACTKRHKSGARHHRGKTARNKKKKAWALFSRWEGDDVTDDETDFLQFCKSRGLARVPTAPPLTTQSSCPNLDVSKNHQRRTVATAGVQASRQQKAETSSIMSDMAKMVNAESKYIEMLCSTLVDKRKFLRDSENRPPTPNDSTVAAENLKKPEITLNTTANKIVRVPPATGEIGKPISNTNAIGEKENTESDSNSSGSSSKSNSKFPKIFMRNEREPAASCSSPISNVSKTKLVYISNSNETKRIPARRPPRQWTAEVENEIMRLYENGAPGTGLGSVDVKPQPRPMSNVRDQVESKLNNADHTPSYVLALANLFRRRMQIRKEFKQVAGDMIDSSLKGSAVPYLANNSFPQQSPKSAAAKNPLTLTNDAPQPVSFRYHHVTSEATAAQDSPKVTRTPTPKNPLAFCSFSSPIVTGIADNTLIQNEDKGNEISPKESVSTSKLHDLDKKEEKIKSEDLNNLLTVFPKPPQFKFSGIQALPGTHEGKDKLKVRTEHGSKSRPGEIARKGQPVGKRSVQSASAPQVRIGLTSGSIPAQKQSPISSKSFELSSMPTQMRENEVFVPQNKRIVDSELDFAIVPMTKVRWSGSLGTLYAKSKPNEQSNIMHSTEVNDPILSSSDARKITNDRLDQSNLMSISPIEKHSKGAVVS